MPSAASRLRPPLTSNVRHLPHNSTMAHANIILQANRKQPMSTIEKQAFSIGNETIDYYVTVMTAKEIFAFSKVSRVDEDPKLGYQRFLNLNQASITSSDPQTTRFSVNSAIFWTISCSVTGSTPSFCANAIRKMNLTISS